MVVRTVIVMCALAAVACAQDPMAQQPMPSIQDVPGDTWRKPEPTPAAQLHDFDAGFLGVHHNTDTFLFWDTGKGARVRNVARGSPAARGGIVHDDIITHFQGKRVTKSEELDRMVRDTPAGSIVVVDLIRSAKRYQTVMRLEARPEFAHLYRREAIEFPHSAPFIFDYEVYDAWDYKRISFVWPLLRLEENGRKTRITVLTWPLSIDFESDR